MMDWFDDILDAVLGFVIPRKWWHWPISVGIWGMVISIMGVLMEIVAHGHVPQTMGQHLSVTVTMSSPFVVFALLLLVRLNRQRHEATLMAAKDPLTGLLNRRAFLDHLSIQAPGVLFLIDLDHFKSVNDNYGHPAGDQLLCAMADVMLGLVRSTDLVGRLGGEEFAVFVPGLSMVDAQALGERLAQGVQNDDTFPQQPVTVTASVGAIKTGRSYDVTTLLKIADRALYQAKEAGRARLVWRSYRPELAMNKAGTPA
ncbi:GGDEF domain-containing protein [Loktanella sp. S4079]|uniref:GGDEF domain-containing protein n=1 Tax=Loktanella sp. S4079 TaxID=579483 RepID=UPI000697DFFE|nr:GGDEF domain-containing protein [Loktanella sp. S4079]